MALRFFSSSLETDQRKEIMHKCTLQVSYNAAGVLAHMASDGPEAWTVRQPERSGSLLTITKWLTKIIIGKMEGKISYLIFVNFFTRAKFLENKIYTEIYTVNCQFTQYTFCVCVLALCNPPVYQRKLV